MIKARYFKSAQFLGIVLALIMLALAYNFYYTDEMDYMYFFLGAAIMRSITLRRFY